MAMLRMPWTITSGLVAVCMIAASILFIMPAEFRRLNNDTVSVQIGWSNFMCDTAQPNVPVNDDEIYAYWQLSKNDRLSSQMVDTGKCAVGVGKYNEKRSSKIDESACYCVHSWWIPVACMAAIGMAVTSLIDFGSGIANRAHRFMEMEEVNKRWYGEMLRMLVLLVVIVTFTLTFQSEFVYTAFGDVYPSVYMHVVPVTWEVGMLLIFGCTFIRLVVFMFMAIVAYRALSASIAKTTGTKAEEPSLPIEASSRPPTKSLADKSVQTSDVDTDDSSDSSVSSIVIKKMRSPPATVLTVCESRGSVSGSRESSIMLTAVEDPPSVFVEAKSSEPEKDPISLIVQAGDKDKKDTKKETPVMTFVQSPERVEMKKEVDKKEKPTSEKK